MYNNHFIMIIQYFIYDFTIAKAMMGYNVREVFENEFPSVVCILRYNPERDWNQNLLCTGTLISPTHVLTAEHCFENSATTPIEITLGSHYLDDSVRHYPLWWISYDQWVIRQRQTLDTVFNDILIMKLFGLPIELQPCSILPIYPPSILYGANVFAVGCGRILQSRMPSVLYVAKLQPVSISECENTVNNLGGENIEISEKYTCTIGDPYTFLDYGDSGGPLIVQGSIVGVNLAVCPHLNEHFHPNKVNIHINMYFFYEFVRNVIDSE